MHAAILIAVLASFCTLSLSSGSAASGRGPRRKASTRGALRPRLHIARPGSGWTARPLETLALVGASGRTVTVSDGAGREYVRVPAGPSVEFRVGGALGTHTVRVLDASGAEVDRLTFAVDAETRVEDADGRYTALFDILLRTMREYREYEAAGVGSTTWRGKTYYWYVPWILDHAHTAKGMQFFTPHTRGLVDLLAAAQRQDGLIWSFVRTDTGPGYYDSAYGPYTWRDGGVLFARQPVENHNEYCFVDATHRAWKGSGDDEWLAGVVDAAARALDYAPGDRARWSERFGLLKRGYTIDSWDFQVEDEYTVQFPLATSQCIDPKRTKFGVFFGDNAGYSHACDQLAEMLDHLGRAADAERWRTRGREVRERLTDVAWNGRFYVHRVEEDPAVVRHLGVDEASQIAMSNAYSLNRGIPHEQCVAILRTYEELRDNLPAGSPGEWYSIYPPYGCGFGKDSGRWQYMNAGVHGHAAGELARGAFEHGFEPYGADILRRVGELAARTDGVAHFAYTGAQDPPPPPQVFTPVDISARANMDLWDRGADGVPGWMGADPGNDLRNLPVGRQSFAGVPYLIADPQANGRRGAIGLACRPGFTQRVEVPLDAEAGAVYLLHASSRPGVSRVAGAVTLRYADGLQHTSYMMVGRDISNWWFPELRSDSAGVAWRGPSPRSNDVGVYWSALTNPHPEKRLRGIAFDAPLEGGTYAVLGVTLADRPPYREPGPVSYGGPDNWAGATCVLALIEGLAGVADEETAFRRVRLSPRWMAAGVGAVSVTARYGASDGYVAYDYRHDAAKRAVELTVTGSGEEADVRVLLPEGAGRVTRATVDGRRVKAGEERAEGSRYAVVPVPLGAPTTVRVIYAP